MPTECIPYQETNYFSGLILDYLKEKEKLKPFFSRFPHPENFKGQIEEKSSFSPENRKVLTRILKEQYSKEDASEATVQNIEALSKGNSFTVVTGHQLNIFTGPLYFLYKIFSTINLTSILKEKYPDYNFVPVYWMATEDHDFEEISFFNLHGKKFKWAKANENAGRDAVGNLSTTGLKEVFELFKAEIGGGKNAEYLKELFKKTYLEHENLTDATRYLANELFKEHGLVILDAQERDLKKLFIPFAENELTRQIANKTTNATAEKLNALGYSVQVNPREINLFYLNDGLRERIVERDGRYFVNDTEITWTKEEILQELKEFPERFSPNVMLRPLYQEVVLPNLCYIGGGAEIAYWLELKKFFDVEKVPFPILLLRNSALIQSVKLEEKRKKLKISYKELFLKPHELINRKVRQISNIDIDFSPQKEHLKQQFQHMYVLAEKTDKTFLSAVKAQEVKQLKGLENLEKRLLKAQKRKLEDEVGRIAALQNELFPNQGLQERQTNFSEFYAEYGKELLSVLQKELNPLHSEFKILTLGKE